MISVFCREKPLKEKLEGAIGRKNIAVIKDYYQVYIVQLEYTYIRVYIYYPAISRGP